MEGEDLAELTQLLLPRIGQVEPEVLVALEQPGDRLAVDALEEAHTATLGADPDALAGRLDQLPLTAVPWKQPSVYGYSRVAL